MRSLRTLLVLAVLLVAAGMQPVDAQFGGLRKKLKKKVEDKVERTVEKRVEARIDRAMDRAVERAVDGVADDLESSIEGFFLSQTPEPIEIGDNETGDADAPFVTYKSVSRIKLLGGAAGGGGIGALLNRFGATQETVYTHGAYQRRDDKRSSEISDAEGKRIIHIDHEEKTYWIMSLEEFAAPMEQLTETGMPTMEVPGTEKPQQAVQELKVTVDRRDGVESINGVPSRRTVAVVEGKFEMSGVDEETGEPVKVEGKSYTVLDQWHSTELAGYSTIRGFERQMAEAMLSGIDREVLTDFAEAMKNSAPGVQAGMTEAFKELGDIEGMIIRSTVHFVQMSPDGTFDLEAVLADNPAEPSSMDPSATRPTYSFVTEIGDLTTQPIDKSIFSPPAEGYEQMESPMKQAMEMMKSGQMNAGQ
jgi:hypothetical protein